MKQIKLIDNLQAFSIDYKITVRHALFLCYGMYLSYQYYSKVRACEQEIREELLNQKPQINQQYQQLYSKSYEGILDCTIDKGDWIFSTENPKINESFNQKLTLNYKYQTIMPLYLCAGIGFPSLAILCSYFQNRDDRFVYGLATAAIFIYCSQNTGLRIDLNIEIPLLENQYVIFNSNSTSQGTNQEITPQTKLLANLKKNSEGFYSQKFDFIELQDQKDLSCYQQNVMILRDVQSCTQSCTLQKDYIQQLGQTNVQQQINNSNYFIIDNTQLPCVYGTFFKILVPWVTVQILFIFQDSSYLIGTIIIVLLVTIITIQIMSIIVLYYKLRKYKKKIKRSQDKNNGKRNIIMRVDYQENLEDQSYSLQEINPQQMMQIQN